MLVLYRSRRAFKRTAATPLPIRKVIMAAFTLVRFIWSRWLTAHHGPGSTSGSEMSVAVPNIGHTIPSIDHIDIEYRSTNETRANKNIHAHNVGGAQKSRLGNRDQRRPLL